MISKTISIFAVLLMCLQAGRPLSAFAQTEDGTEPGRKHGGSLAALSFGFKAGASFSQHTGSKERNSEYTVKSHWQSGIVAGAFLFFPVTSRFGLQQEVMYVQKGSQQEIKFGILDVPTVLHVTYDLDYVEIPVLTKFTWFRRDRTSLYSVAGTALSLKVSDRYILKGEIDDGSQTVLLQADSDMSEVDMFDYSFVYGLGMSVASWNRRMLIEYRFTIGWNTLLMPTYTYVPVGDEQVLIDNEPVPLKNQAHLIMLGISF